LIHFYKSIKMERTYFEATFKDPIKLGGTEVVGAPWDQIKLDLLNEREDEREEKIAFFLNRYRTDPIFDKLRDKDEKGQDKSMTREELIKFLRAGAWDINAAITVLKNYLQSGRQNTSVVDELNPKKLDKVWMQKLNAITEYRDVYGRRIYIYRPGSWDTSNTSIDEFFASTFCMFELMAEEVRTQIAGVTCVVDMAGFGFKHLRCIGLDQVKCGTGFLAGSFPLWIRRIHIVNNPAVFSVLHNMMKPFLEDRVKNNMVFHGTNYTELHKAVPPFLLPQSCGGPGEIEDEACVKLVKEMSNKFEDIWKMSTFTTAL